MISFVFACCPGFSRARIDYGKERSGETGAIWTRPAIQPGKRFQQLAGCLCCVKQRQNRTGLGLVFVFGTGLKTETETKAPAAVVPPYDPFRILPIHGAVSVEVAEAKADTDTGADAVALYCM